MQASKPSFQKYLFVCENEKDGACCGKNGQRLREVLKARVKAAGLSNQIRVSRAGCLDVCSYGPNILLMPEAVWFQGVEEKDLDSIIEKARS